VPIRSQSICSLILLFYVCGIPAHEIDIRHGVSENGRKSIAVFLDGGNETNDEARPLPGGEFVDNLAIVRPDRALGVTLYNYNESASLSLAVYLDSSNGLSNSPDVSYSDVVDATGSGEGVSAVAELSLPWRGLEIRPGVWMNSEGREYLDQSGRRAKNYGFYANIDGQAGRSQWSLHLGIANKDASETARIAAVALDYPFRDFVLGVGITHTLLSGYAVDTQASDETQAEAYARIKVASRFELTPSVQWLRSSGFNGFDDGIGGTEWAGLLQLSHDY